MSNISHPYVGATRCSNAFYRNSFETSTTIVNNEIVNITEMLAGWLAWVVLGRGTSWQLVCLVGRPRTWTYADWVKLEHGLRSTHHTTHTHLPPFPLSICIFILGSHVGAHGSVRFSSLRCDTVRFGSIDVSIGQRCMLEKLIESINRKHSAIS